MSQSKEFLHGLYEKAFNASPSEYFISPVSEFKEFFSLPVYICLKKVSLIRCSLVYHSYPPSRKSVSFVLRILYHKNRVNVHILQERLRYVTGHI